MKNYLQYGITHALYNLLDAMLKSSIIGYSLIFAGIEMFGKTDFMSWECWIQIFMVAFGGTLISRK